VLAHRLEAAAEVDALRADRCREQLGERRRERRAAVERAQEVLGGGGMEPTQERQDLVADQPALRVGVRGVDAELHPGRAAVDLRLLAPERQQRVDDSVAASRRDAGRGATRD